MSKSEIITVQLGHYANFVGTHWWNMLDGSFGRQLPGFEKEIDHDRLFHTGLTMKGEETYTPRMVFMDLKGSLRHLRRDGSLYESGDADVEQASQLWDGSVEQQVSEPSAKNPYLADLDDADAAYLDPSGTPLLAAVSATAAQSTAAASTATAAARQQPVVPLPDRRYDLDDTIEVWSDFIRPHLHPRSACVVKEYTHGSESNPFDVYSHGIDVMESGSVASAFEDQIRYFAEACDRLQAFQLLTDVHDGFGGVSTEVLNQLRDEYEKKAIFSVATMPSSFTDMTAQRVACRQLGAAYSLQKLAEGSSMLLPLCTSAAAWWPGAQGHSALQSSYIDYKPDLWYHTSALLAATLDSATLPYRLQRSDCTVHQMADLLTPLGRKVTSAYAALPFPFKAGQKLVDSFAQCPALHDPSLSMAMTPMTHDDDMAYAQYATMRGIPAALAKQTEAGDLKPDDAFRTYLGNTPSAMINSSCYVNEASIVAAPFPNIFKSDVTIRGFVETEETYLRPAEFPVLTLPVMAAIQSRNCTNKLIEQVVNSAEKTHPRRQFAFYQSSLSADAWSDAKENLLQLADNYSE